MFLREPALDVASSACEGVAASRPHEPSHEVARTGASAPAQAEQLPLHQFASPQQNSAPGCLCSIYDGQERGAVALSSEAVSGLVVASQHRLGRSLGFVLLRHGPLPLTASLLQPASSQTPFLQVDPAQLVVDSRVVEKVQRQQHHDEEAVDPHADQGRIITA
ncbi:hypothetical protein EYF80_013752 [Liparis tanakae]|uniref:Uncharacterized protein n=1 Tax=Liparis tanakae TaxID=230148 RepID=A0A4Z2ID30_9TELE|nr:hypothetical protein EYF80_013752 [Liparis tanakae]